MPVHTHEDEFQTWRVDALPLAIEISTSVLEELRQTGEQNFQTIPHGGIEVGAILYGVRDGSTLRILEWRPISCEHARGPGFLLSTRDRETLAASLATPAPELAGLEPVGWFHTHTRSPIFLSDEDLQIFDQFFPHPWQTALVMNLAKEQFAKAGFFLREPDNSIRASASYLEFTVRPNPMAATHTRPTAIPRPPATRDRRARQPQPQPLEPPSPPTPAAIVETPEPPPPVPEPPPPTPEPEPPAPPAAELPPPPAKEPPPVRPPDPYILPDHPPVPLTPADSRWRPIARVFLTMLIIAAAAIALAVGVRWYSTIQPPDTIGLRLQKMNDQVLIQWDHSAPTVRRADSGLLLITDGRDSHRFPLDALNLRRGVFTYLPATQNLNVRLTLSRRNRVTMQDSVRYSDPTPRPPVQATASAADTEAEKAQLQAEIERLERELATESRKPR